MRDAFFKELYGIATEDRNVVAISADCGAPSLDEWRRDLPQQFVNVGIAEQNMVSIAAGLALEGKRPYCYAIAPFATFRCLEQIRVDLCMMNLPVTILGVGAGYSYDLSGPTHHALEDIAIMRALPNMTVLSPSDNTMVRVFAHVTYREAGPKYIRLDRAKLPQIRGEDFDLSDGFQVLKKGEDLTIIATGYMVHQAVKVADGLLGHRLRARVIDLYRLKPLNRLLLGDILEHSRLLVTLEEHFGTGGLGSILAELLADTGFKVPLERLYIPDHYSFEYGGREFLHRNLNPGEVVQRLIARLGG